MPDRVYLFDVDGTLTEPREKIKEQIEDVFMSWIASKSKSVYLVTGSDISKTKEQLGEFAVNCCPLPGYLIGPTRFRSLKANQLLKELDVMHITVPTTQFRLSGGSVHCLTNEL